MDVACIIFVAMQNALDHFRKEEGAYIKRGFHIKSFCLKLDKENAMIHQWVSYPVASVTWTRIVAFFSASNVISPNLHHSTGDNCLYYL